MERSVMGLDVVSAFDEFERRRRREAAAFREWLVAVTSGQAGSMSLAGLLGAQGGGVSMPLLLGFEDSADELGVSESTVKRLVRRGELPAVKVGGRSMIRRADLDRFVAALEPVVARVEVSA